MSNRKGFFEGMPEGAQIRLVAWVLYFFVAAVLFFQNPLIGGTMFVLPVIWFAMKNLVLIHFGGRTDLERNETVIGYTLSYLMFDAPMPVRVISGVAMIVAVLFSLGWVSTENLRAEAAKPTLTERVSTATTDAIDATKEKTGALVTSAGDATSAAVDATKETTSGWWGKAKGWWKGDEAAPTQ